MRQLSSAIPATTYTEMGTVGELSQKLTFLDESQGFHVGYQGFVLVVREYRQRKQCGGDQ